MKLGQWSRKTRFQSLLLPLPGCVTLDKCLGWVLQKHFREKGLGASGLFGRWKKHWQVCQEEKQQRRQTIESAWCISLCSGQWRFTPLRKLVVGANIQPVIPCPGSKETKVFMYQLLAVIGWGLLQKSTYFPQHFCRLLRWRKWALAKSSGTEMWVLADGSILQW